MREPKHYRIPERVAVSTAGPDYYVISSGALTEEGMLCLIDIQPGDTVELLHHCSPVHNTTKPLLLAFVKFREDDDGQAVFKKKVEAK